jgi:G3E family GTPase
MSSDPDVDRVNIYLHGENVRIFGTREPRRLPVTIVTGFLGAGKTTLLKHLLENKQNLKIAAAINDFGALNIDGSLVKATSRSNKTIELSNGCCCCSILDDLTAAVWNLLQELDKTAAYDYLVIETSGVTDPRKIVASLDASFGKMYRARLDSVVAVVDVDAWTGQSVAGVKQVKSADIVLLNKTDLVSAERLASVTETVHSLCPSAKTIPTVNSRVPISRLLDVVDTKQLAETGGPTPITHEQTDAPYFVSATGGALRTAQPFNLDALNHLDQDRFTSCSFVFPDRPILLRDWTRFVRTLLPTTMLVRAKGILWITEEPGDIGGSAQGRGAGTLEAWRCVFHMSGRSPGRWSWELDGEWTGPPESRLVFIGLSLDEQVLKDSLLGVTPDSAWSSSQVGVETVKGVQNWEDDPRFTKIVPGEGSGGATWVRLTGTTYGFKDDEEIRQNARVDMDTVNRHFVNAINASLDEPKVFFVYSQLPGVGVVVCIPPSELKEEASVPLSSRWWWNTFDREATLALKTAFADVKVCKCD